eukprot:scaffold7747_cov140-Isochrysis_galbana.AAC.2
MTGHVPKWNVRSFEVDEHGDHVGLAQSRAQRAPTPAGHVGFLLVKHPLGNPYPVGTGAPRSMVVAAMRRVLGGESVAA